MLYIKLLVILSTVVYSTLCTCKIVINEVNIIDSKFLEKNDYIELKQSCDKGNEMSLVGKVFGYLILAQIIFVTTM